MTSATKLSCTPATEQSRIEDLTRREFMFSALGAALLIACGDDDEPDPTATPTSAPATRLYTDDAGREVEIPVRPGRVVALSDLNAGIIMLEIGVKPAGMVLRGGEWNPGSPITST